LPETLPSGQKGKSREDDEDCRARAGPDQGGHYPPPRSRKLREIIGSQKTGEIRGIILYVPVFGILRGGGNRPLGMNVGGNSFRVRGGGGLELSGCKVRLVRDACSQGRGTAGNCHLPARRKAAGGSERGKGINVNNSSLLGRRGLHQRDLGRVKGTYGRESAPC